jgi:hypothetical protein
MPKQELDNAVNAAHSARADLKQRREGITNALENAATTQARQQQALEAAQKKAVGNSALADDPRVKELLSNQRNQLDSNQKTQVDLMNQALAAAAHAEKNGADGRRQALQLINTAADLNGSLIESAKQQRSAELENLRSLSAINNATQRGQEIGELLSAQKAAAERLERDVAVGAAALERRASLVQNTLDRDQRDRLQAVTMQAANSEKLRSILSADTMQRLADEALHPGRQRLQDADKDNTIQRVKGELAEQMAADDVRREIDQENKTRAKDRQLFLIEGNRLRDEQGRKMSDGLIAWRDTGQKLQIWQALEVKSGPAAARELNYKIEKLTEKQDQELRKYASDVANESVKAMAGLTASQQRNETQRLTKEAEAYLRSGEVQKEAGQRQQTTERLDVTQRLYIDGRACQASMDRERRLNDIVQRIATADALKRDNDVRRLDVSSQELNRVATAFVEELFRQRKMT